MSRFAGKTAAAIAPYVPGEQPTDKSYIKLNTNECPYPPSPKAAAAIAAFDPASLRLYPDPDSGAIKQAAAAAYGLEEKQVFVGGGSDEILACAFLAFCDQSKPVCFPDITYGFYKVYADLFSAKAEELPLDDDFQVNISSYAKAAGPVLLANPNAPIGICLDPAQIEELLRQNADRLVIIDEAYIDFAPGKTCLPLLEKYGNLLVVQTFSKSRGLAGLRIGLAFGSEELIYDLERIKYSFNPYNIDRLTGDIAIAVLGDKLYCRETAAKIISTRQRTAKSLSQMGFNVLPSSANFLMAFREGISGEELYRQLKARGILVRHFQKPRISGFIRISVGTDSDMDAFLGAVRQILSERGLAL